MARKKQGAKIEDCFAGWIEDAVKPLKNKAKPANRHDVTPLHVAFPLLIFRKQRADHTVQPPHLENMGVPLYLSGSNKSSTLSQPVIECVTHVGVGLHAGR